MIAWMIRDKKSKAFIGAGLKEGAVKIWAKEGYAKNALSQKRGSESYHDVMPVDTYEVVKVEIKVVK